MDEPMLNETQALRQAYAALNRGDIDGFVSVLDPEIVRIEFENTPLAGEFRGIEAVTEHVRNGRSTWAEGSCEPEQFIAAGDKVVVLTNVHVRLNGRADWLDGRTGDVFTFRNGRAIEFRTFAEPDEALKFAGADRS